MSTPPLDALLANPQYQGLPSNDKLTAIRNWEDDVLKTRNASGDWDLQSKYEHDIKTTQARQAALGIEPLPADQIAKNLYANKEEEDRMAELSAGLDELTSAEKEGREINALKLRTWGDWGLDDEYLKPQMEEVEGKIYAVKKRVGETELEQARQALEAREGKRDYATIRGKLVINPDLYYNREKFLEVVKNSGVSENEKAQALSEFTRRREDQAKAVIPDLEKTSSFAPFAEEFAAKNPGATNADVVGAFKDSWASEWEQTRNAAKRGGLSFAQSQFFLPIGAAKLLKAAGLDTAGQKIEDLSMSAMKGLQGAKDSVSQEIETLGGLNPLQQGAEVGSVVVGDVIQTIGVTGAVKLGAKQLLKQGVKKALSREMAKEGIKGTITQEVRDTLLKRNPTKRLAFEEYSDMVNKTIGTLVIPAQSSGGSTFYDSYLDERKSLAEEGLTGEELEAEARSGAFMKAARTGLVTGAITHGFGMRGAEAVGRLTQIAANPASRESLKKATVGYAEKVLGEAVSETLEESLDQGINGGLDALLDNPDMTFEDWTMNVLKAGAMGGVLGGGIGGITVTAESILDRKKVEIDNSPEVVAKREAVRQAQEAGLTETAAAMERNIDASVTGALDDVIDEIGGAVETRMQRIDELDTEITKLTGDPDAESKIAHLRAERDTLLSQMGATQETLTEDPAKVANLAVAELVAEDDLAPEEARAKVLGAMNGPLAGKPAPVSTVIAEARRAPAVVVDTPPVTEATPDKTPTFREIAGRPALVDNESGDIKIEEDGTVVLDRGTSAPPLIISRNADVGITETEFDVSLDEELEADRKQAEGVMSGKPSSTPITRPAPKTTYVRDDGTVVTSAQGPGLSSQADFVSAGVTESGDDFVTVKDRENGTEFELHGDDALEVLLARKVLSPTPDLESLNADLDSSGTPEIKDGMAAITRHLKQAPNLLTVTTRNAKNPATPAMIKAAREELNTLRTNLANEQATESARDQINAVLDEVEGDLNRAEKRGTKPASRRATETPAPARRGPESSPAQTPSRKPAAVVEPTPRFTPPTSKVGALQKALDRNRKLFETLDNMGVEVIVTKSKKTAEAILGRDLKKGWKRGLATRGSDRMPVIILIEDMIRVNPTNLDKLIHHEAVHAAHFTLRDEIPGLDDAAMDTLVADEKLKAQMEDVYPGFSKLRSESQIAEIVVALSNGNLRLDQVPKNLLDHIRRVIDYLLGNIATVSPEIKQLVDRVNTKLYTYRPTNENTTVTPAPAENNPPAGQTPSERSRFHGPGEVSFGTGELQYPDGTRPTTPSLTGLPATVTTEQRGKLTFGAFAPAREAAEKYAERSGIPYNPPTTYAKVDKERAGRIADAFEAMPHDPTDPATRESYDAMISETLAQWQVIKETGLIVEPITAEMGVDPYDNPRFAIVDVVENNHLWFYPTEAGFGSDETIDVSDNPLLGFSDEYLNGKRLQYNDLFRIVHDYFGHIKEGVGFRADGEENAWRVHSAMYSDKARPAMTTETRGQNSWVNFGPHAQANKTASGAETVYAPQKIGLLPDWVINEGAGDVGETLTDEQLTMMFDQVTPALDMAGFSDPASVLAEVEGKMTPDQKTRFADQIAALQKEVDKEEAFRDLSQDPLAQTPMRSTSDGNPDGDSSRDIVLDIDRRRVFSLLGERMYDSQIGVVINKELAQNSFDAIKEAEATGLIPEGRGVFTQHIEKDSVNNLQYVTYIDNGVGMTPDIVQKAFFTVGGTHKGAGKRSGGFGLAKMGIFMAAERVELITTRDGVTTTANVTSEQLLGEVPWSIESKQTGLPSGTLVRLTFPTSITKSNGKEQSISMYTADATNLIHHDLTFYYPDSYPNEVTSDSLVDTFKNEGVPQGFRRFLSSSNKPLAGLQRKKVLGEMESKQMVTPEGIVINAYYKRIGKDSSGGLKWRESIMDESGENAVFNLTNSTAIYLSNGAYQFENYNLDLDPNDYSSGKLPYSIIFDVDASDIPAESTDYPFTNSRESLNPESSVKKMTDTFLDQLRASEMIKSAEKEFEVLESVRPGKPKRHVPVLYNNTTTEVSPEERVYLVKLAKEIYRIADEIIEAFNAPEWRYEYSRDAFRQTLFGEGKKMTEDHSDGNTQNYFYGVGLSKNWGGVHYGKKGVLLINPVYAPTDRAYSSPELHAAFLYHVIFHEINHIQARNEGADFTWNLTITDAELSSRGIRNSSVKKLTKLSKEYFDQILSLRSKFNYSDTLDNENEIQADYSRTPEVSGKSVVPSGPGTGGISDVSRGDLLQNERPRLAAGLGFSRPPATGTLDSGSSGEASFGSVVEDGLNQLLRDTPLETAPTSQSRDAEYLAAVNRGDIETAQRMVDAAAKMAGYLIGPVWHGSRNLGFTSFGGDVKNANSDAIGSFINEEGFSFSDSKQQAEMYAGESGEVRPFYLKLKNPYLYDYKGKGPWWKFHLAISNRQKAGGHDGAIITNIKDIPGRTKEDFDAVEPATTYRVTDPNSIKSADPVTRDSGGNVIPLSQRFNPASDSILEVPAWHGTPHKIEGGFRVDRIGTGEGAQAFGHGLYFAESKSVGEDYQKSLGQWKLDGVSVRDLRRQHPSSTMELAFKEGIDIEKAAEKFNKVKTEIEALNAVVDYPGNEILMAKSPEAKALLKEWKSSGRLKHEGNLYRVEILADPETEFLDWDKPVTEQSDYVKTALQKADIYEEKTPYGAVAKGEYIYHSEDTSLEKKSRRLLDAGIKGIRYRDGNTRFAVPQDRWHISPKKPGIFSVTDGLNGPERAEFFSYEEAEEWVLKQPGSNKPTYNYVVFDESLVEILEENGQPVSKKERDQILEITSPTQSPTAPPITPTSSHEEAVESLVASAIQRYPDIPTTIDRSIPSPARTVGTRMVVNPDQFAQYTEGLNDRDIAAMIDKVFIHEVTHVAAIQDLGAEFPSDYAKQMTADERIDIAAHYLHRSAYNTDEDYYRAVAEFAGNDKNLSAAEKRIKDHRLGHEALRMLSERMRTGYTTEETIAFMKMNPNLLQRAIRYLRAYVNRLRAHYQVSKDPALSVEMDRLNRAIDEMVNGPSVDRGEQKFMVPVLGTTPLEASSFGGPQRVPLANFTPVAGEYRMGGKMTAANKFDVRVYKMREKAMGLIQGGMKRAEFFAKKINGLLKTHFDKQGLDRPLDLVNTALGNIDNRITEADEAQVKQIKRAGLSAAQGKYLSARAQANQLEQAGMIEDAIVARVQAREIFDADVVAYKEAAETFIQQARERARVKARNDQRAALAALPKDLANEIENLRIHIDQLGDRMIAEGALSEELKATIDENRGLWLHRSYRIFDDPNYAIWVQESKDPEAEQLRNKTYTFIQNDLIRKETARLIGTGVPAAQAALDARTNVTPLHVRATFEDYISVADSGAKSLLQGVEVIKDTQMLMARGVVPDEIQELWGVNKDVSVNAAKSLASVQQFLATHEFYQNIKDLGMADGWLKEYDPKDPSTKFDRQGNTLVELFPNNGMSTRYGNKPDSRYAPLAGIYGPPALAEALQEVGGTQLPKWLKVFQQHTGFAMATNTSMSWGSMMRNFWSNVLPVIFNGNAFTMASGKKQKEAWTLVWDNLFARGEDSVRDRVVRMVELGLFGDSVAENLIRDLMGGYETQTKAVRGISKYLPKQITNLINAGKKGLDFAGKAYSSPDELGKMFAYFGELERVRSYRPGATEAAIEEEAADIVKNTMPTYSRAPEFVKAIRTLPVIAPYVTFPFEMYRVTMGTARIGAQHIREGRKTGNKEMEKAGWSRLFSATMTTTGMVGAPILVRSLLGFDDRDEDDLRNHLPEWEKNVSLIVLPGSDLSEGINYMNLSYVNPYDGWLRPVRAFLRELDNPDAGILDATWEGAEELFNPVTNEQLLAGAIMDVRRGVTATGKPVWERNDSKMTKTIKSLDHLFGVAYKPGIVKSAERVTNAAMGVVSDQGNAPALANEVVNATLGQKVSRASLQTSLGYAARTFKFAKNEGSGDFNKNIRSKGTRSDGEILSSYLTSNAKTKAAYQEFYAKTVSAIRVGAMTRQDAIKLMQAEKVPEADIIDILNNRYRRLDLGDAALRDAKEQGTKLSQDRIDLYRRAISQVPVVEKLSEDDYF